VKGRLLGRKAARITWGAKSWDWPRSKSGIGFWLFFAKKFANCRAIIAFEISSPVNGVGRHLAKPSVCTASP
jgi:hypothetical protein